MLRRNLFWNLWAVEKKADGPNMHQLIIIGNGFDLSCDLKSSFRDYMTYREVRLALAKNNYVVGGGNPGVALNIWDLILRRYAQQDECLWCDIEGAMTKALVGDSEHEPLVGTVPNHRMSSNDSHSSLLGPFDLPDEIYSFVKQRIGDEPLSKELFYQVLREQLSAYEREFACYLRDELSRNESRYYDLAHSRLWALDQNEVGNVHPIETSLLNFNYTDPMSGGGPGPLRIDHRVNVHGSLGRWDVVFGIDGKDVLEGDVAMPFTKTYRLLSLGLRREVVVRGSGDAETTSLIKFFGHSLAQPDYSYFQAIFDAVDLYGGQTTLVFYYLPYMGKDDMAAREEQCERVTHLLSVYGQTLDNKDHGKNLMHKLLLEGRLRIMRLENGSSC